MDRMLTVAEVAETLGRSTRFVRDEILRGNLVAYRIGKAYAIRESDLEQYIRTRQVVPFQSPNPYALS